MTRVVLMLPLLVLTLCFWLLLQVDADAHAVSDFVADGNEVDGDIRVSGIKTA